MVNNVSLLRSPHRLITAANRATHEGFAFDKKTFLSNLREDKKIIEFRRSLWSMVRRSHRIVIFGDYDADGIISTYLLYNTITNYINKGATTKVVLPQRRWGYGLGDSAISVIALNNPDLVILLDNGIKAKNEVGKIKSKLGSKVIIIDHHAYRQDDPPDADLIVHSSWLPAAMESCAAGLAWVLCRFDVNNDTDVLRTYDQLGALGTIADSMPLRAFNFGLAKIGIQSCEEHPIPAIQMLLNENEYADTTSATMEDEWRYKVIPAINATGRIGDPHQSFAHLINPSQETSNVLIGLNKRRKDMLTRLANIVAEDLACRNTPYPYLGALTYYLSPDVCRVDAAEAAGLIGLISQRLSAWYQSPAIVFTDSAENPDLLVGSMRMPADWNGKTAVDLLSHAQRLLLRYGGHAHAAGATIPRQNLDAFTETLSVSSPGSPRLRYDLRVQFPILSLIYADQELRAQMECMRPFGEGNPSIRLCLNNIRITASADTENRLLLNMSANGVQINSMQMQATWWANEHCFPPSLKHEAIVALVTHAPEIIVSPEIASVSSNLYACHGIRMFGVANQRAFATLIQQERDQRAKWLGAATKINLSN